MAGFHRGGIRAGRRQQWRASTGNVTALVNANLIDGRGNAPAPNQTILITDGRISAVFPSGSRPLPPGTRTIDLTGQTVLPGLVEGHVHLTANPKAADGLRKMLRTGITTVRDLAGSHSPVFPAAVHHVVQAQPDQIIHSKGFITAGATDLPDNFDEGTGKWIASQDFRGTDPDTPRFRALFASMVGAGIILEPALLADIDLPGRRVGIDMPQRTGPRPPWVEQMADWACKLTEAAYRAGVTISAGTDTYGNQPYLQREIVRLVKCGLSPVDAIQAATYNNAKAVGLQDTIGSIEEGKRADLVVIASDPSEDIGRIGNVRVVIKNGAIVDIAE